MVCFGMYTVASSVFTYTVTDHDFMLSSHSYLLNHHNFWEIKSAKWDLSSLSQKTGAHLSKVIEEKTLSYPKNAATTFPMGEASYKAYHQWKGYCYEKEDKRGSICTGSVWKKSHHTCSSITSGTMIWNSRMKWIFGQRGLGVLKTRVVSPSLLPKANTPG